MVPARLHAKKINVFYKITFCNAMQLQGMGFDGVFNFTKSASWLANGEKMISFNNRKNMLRMAGLTTVPFALALVTGTAHAQDSSMFSYSGFGTFGVAHSNSTNGDYVATLFQRSGAGASHDWDVGVDSKLGAQLNAKFTEQLSAVVQVTSMARPNNTFGARVEWANLQYAVTPDFKVRIGRTAVPIFMVSDTRLVGYANTWIRPPVEMYSAIPITNLDGGDASYKYRFGNVTHTVQAFAGTSHVDVVTFDGTIIPDTDVKQTWGINDSIEYGAWAARIGYFKSDVIIKPSPVTSVTLKSESINIGAVYDPGTWFIQGEFSQVKLKGLSPTQNVSYLSGGYRFGNVTPYAMYVRTKPKDTNASVIRNQKTTSLGLRWDVMKNTALKVQAERIELGKGNTGFFTNVKPALAGSTVNLLSFAVDFVF